MKRGDLNSACAGSHDKLSAESPSRFVVPIVEHRDEWGSLFRGDPIKTKDQTVWASP
jgi:hypothetical protein